MRARIQSCGRTDIGRRRETNQDHFLIADLFKSMMVHHTSLQLSPDSRLYGSPQGRLFVVADGMGGHKAGRRASTLAIDFLVNRLLNSMHWLYRLEQVDREDMFCEDLRTMLIDAHAAIDAESRTSSDYKGMGTTLTMAYVVWPKVYVAHVGDSRCYLLRDGQIKQLTRDHTMANQLIANGGLKEAEAAKSPWSNVLYNALGGGAKNVTPEISKHELHVDDALLLCSDGLYRHINDLEIIDITQRDNDPDQICTSLIDLANFRGGHDNLTTLYAKFLVPDTEANKTRVATMITLEKMLGDLSGYDPDSPFIDEETGQSASDTLDFTKDYQ